MKNSHVIGQMPQVQMVQPVTDTGPNKQSTIVAVDTCFFLVKATKLLVTGRSLAGTVATCFPICDNLFSRKDTQALSVSVNENK
jgi:hypothetical protein